MELQNAADLVDSELRRIGDAELAKRIRELRVTPYPVVREWDYNPPGSRFTCWTVVEHRLLNTAIAIARKASASSCPWGVVVLSGPDMNIGMDDHWFATLEEAPERA